MSSEQLQSYQSYVDALYFPVPGIFFRGTDEGWTMAQMQDQFAAGLLSAQEFVQKMDHLAEMVEMENDDIFGLNSRSEVSPALLYIANVYTSIVAISSNQVGIRAETVCSEKVKTITVTYILQKWNGSKWVGIASKTASAYGVAQTSKSYTITGVSSGRYRTKATASVTGYNGYTESLTGYSGSITI